MSPNYALRRAAGGISAALILIGLAASIVAVTTWSDESEARRWSAFSAEHNCRLIFVREGNFYETRLERWQCAAGLVIERSGR